MNGKVFLVSFSAVILRNTLLGGNVQERVRSVPELITLTPVALKSWQCVRTPSPGFETPTPTHLPYRASVCRATSAIVKTARYVVVAQAVEVLLCATTAQ